MPIVKPISGHSSAKYLRDYLVRGERAIAQDYINLDAPEAAASFDWAAEMDATRVAYGNDRPWRGMRVRTYKHYIVSPDPQDAIDLDSLRSLATEWAQRHFGCHEVAIVYHDDNASGIPHAHIVVNNTNLRTGRRLQDPDPGALNRSLQVMAAERGLRHFDNSRRPEGVAARANRRDVRQRPKSLQSEHVGRAEAELLSQGKYSWTADIRDRVRIARSVARNEAEFRGLLSSLGIEVSDNSPRAPRRDWVYSFADNPGRRITGEKLGLNYGRERLLSLLDNGGAARFAPATEVEIARIAKNAVAIGDLGELKLLSRAVLLVESKGVTTLADLETLEKSAGNSDAEACEYIRRIGILPETTRAMSKRERAEPNHSPRGHSPRLGGLSSDRTRHRQADDPIHIHRERESNQRQGGGR